MMIFVFHWVAKNLITIIGDEVLLSLINFIIRLKGYPPGKTPTLLQLTYLRQKSRATKITPLTEDIYTDLWTAPHFLQAWAFHMLKSSGSPSSAYVFTLPAIISMLSGHCIMRLLK